MINQEIKQEPDEEDYLLAEPGADGMEIVGRALSKAAKRRARVKTTIQKMQYAGVFLPSLSERAHARRDKRAELVEM